ncbi:MAG: hypothetical protein E6J04_18630 [Chloroflexi bacterium]|nr:MAG: hypothetical protein E6J04_18630 [Chloroflexota bacterium]
MAALPGASAVHVQYPARHTGVSAALSRSADQLFLVLFTEQGRRHPTKQGGQLRFLFWRPAVKQLGQVIMAGGR